ncbi:MAG: nucleotidyltransferase family protein, partial [Solirubrobacteraceae bacterium]
MIGGVVLAAGGASRFGSPKQLAELDGRPLLQHAVDAMLAVPAIDPVVVVLGAEAERVRAAVDLGEALSVVCDGWADGMAASLRCGVEAVGDSDWVIVTLGDQPRVTPQVIAAVMDHAESAPAGTVAVRATYDGAPGHPVALGRAMLPRLAQLSGDAGARDLLGGADVRTFEAARLCDPA